MPPARLPLLSLPYKAIKYPIVTAARAAVDLHNINIPAYIVLEAVSHKCVDKHHRPAYCCQTDSVWDM